MSHNWSAHERATGSQLQTWALPHHILTLLTAAEGGDDSQAADGEDCKGKFAQEICPVAMPHKQLEAWELCENTDKFHGGREETVACEPLELLAPNNLIPIKVVLVPQVGCVNLPQR